MRIRLRKFVLLLIVYGLVGSVVFLNAASTSPGWIIYFIFLGPFYLVWVLYGLKLLPQHPQATILLKLGKVLPSLLGQGLVILTSPANCYGWHQGSNCVSFWHTYLSQSQDYWFLNQGLFLIYLLVYIVLVSIFLITTFDTLPRSGNGQ